MPIRKPRVVTAAELNALMQRVSDVMVNGLHGQWPLLAPPPRLQTVLAPSGAHGWRYDAAGGYAYSTGAGGGGIDDHGTIPVDTVEGDRVVGWRALCFNPSSTPNMKVAITKDVDGTGSGTVDLATELTISIPQGVWTWVEHSFAPITISNFSVGLDLFAFNTSPGQRYGMGFVIVDHP